jgi:NADH:ubiquinone oxidoreductase subunit E
VGCCGLAPVVTVGEELYGKVTPSKVASLVSQYADKKETEPCPS